MGIGRADRDLVSLAVLGLLLGGPKHTYEMQRMMVETRKDFVTGLPRSMYHAVDKLQRTGSITPVETVRVSGKPERTVYAITERGSAELQLRLELLLAQPDPDATLFVAALSFLACLPTRRATAALRARAEALTEHIETTEADLADAPTTLPAVLLVEARFELATARSQRDWVRGVLADLESGRLDWSDDITRLTPDSQPEKDSR
ncbi:PadR family transcriptional regulator [Enemella evansiae]|uniref:PadR family transcriptional regulator n=1 Tax=Enemella evansiae TaxID=2016499 RepID=UPI000B96996B|nr:helix-turn-helix transcriptional regulator [Enemella evansiae]OYO12378.1 PadR family transcriptional regulator [Enemella evansiae]